MPAEISDIANGLLTNPVTVEVRAEVVPIDRIAQHLVHLPVAAKRDALLKILSARDVTRAMVFARTKHGANRLCEHLVTYGLKAVVIHGNKSQGARQKALAEFKSGEATILVATDIAARGIDVADVSHVVNAELPDEPEAYVHRIGRTARAGKAGVSITLCAPEEKDKLKAVEKLLKRAIPTMVVEGLDLSKAAGARISELRDTRGRGGRPERERHGRRGEEKPREARPARSRDDRPQSNRPRREEPREQGAWAEKPWTNRPGDAPREDRPRQERPRQDEARQDRPRQERARQEHPRRDEARRDEPRAARPARGFDDRPRQGQPRFGDEMRPARDNRAAPQRGERSGLLPSFIERGAGERAPRRDDRPAPRGRSGKGGRRFG